MFSTWKTKCLITCNSLNVIYFLKCAFCRIVTKLGKTDNLRQRTNNHISGCRNGKGTDLFDNHVFECSRLKGMPPNEPFFLLFSMMACNDYSKLLNIERNLHFKGHDTIFKLLWHISNGFCLHTVEYVKFYTHLKHVCRMEKLCMFLNSKF